MSFEALREQVDDHHRPKAGRDGTVPSDLLGVLARLEHADDGRVRAGSADAVLLELFDQRRLTETRWGLGELLLGVERASATSRSPFA